MSIKLANNKCSASKAISCYAKKSHFFKIIKISLQSLNSLHNSSQNNFSTFDIATTKYIYNVAKPNRNRLVGT